MCGLCGVFSESHWSDATVTSAAEGGRTRRHERLHRVALANRVLQHVRVKVADWNGASYLVNGPSGQTAIVASISEVWAAAETFGKRPLDPLDDSLIGALERA